MNVLKVKKYYHLIKKAKFSYSYLGKAFEKQTKDQGKNKYMLLLIKKRLVALTNKDDDHKDNYKKIFE